MRDAPRYPSPEEPLGNAEAEVTSAAEPDQLQAVLGRLEVLLERALGPQAQQAARPVAPEAAAWHEPGLSEAVLQELRFTAPRSGPSVAYVVLAGQVQALGSGIQLARGARVSFSSYLNSFYEHYWVGHAPVRDLALRLIGTGEVVVQFFRALPDGSDYCIGSARIALEPQRGGVARIALANAPAGAGRIFFDITATAPATLHAGRLETGTAPVRPVRLGIGLCSFNREDMLLANLQQVVQSPYWRWAAPRIVIVNQGRRFASAEMAALLATERDRIEVIEQGNLGGAGGFTRAAMEILRDGACSHVLFMDDDIEFDPSVLVTTHAFAARCIAPTVIGGAMVDLFRPTTLYEVGAVIDPRNILRTVLHNRRIDGGGKLDDLAREIPCHFNGWWYCAIPAGMFREYGLPLPIFIRGDDMEYGVRLMSHGVPTVSLPPVAVWHEPFYAKPPGWQLYYDLRNRLIFAACQPDLVRLDPPVVILRRLIDSLLKHDYMHAELVIRAAEDFLAGPAVLDTPMDALHGEIAALAAAHAPHRPPSAVGMMPSVWRKPPRIGLRQLTLALGLAALMLGVVRTRLRPKHLFIDQWHPWMVMHVSQYGLSDRMGSYVQVYRYDRARLRNALWRGLRVVWRYRREARGIAPRWRAAHAELSSWARWERIFGFTSRSAAEERQQAEALRSNAA